MLKPLVADGLVAATTDYDELRDVGAILVALLALLLDGLIALVERFAVSPGLSGKFRNTPGNRPVVSTTARGDAATETASPTDRADEQREALV